jgi:hypothetical protein
VHRDIALSLLCVAAFGLAVVYVGRKPLLRNDHEQRAARIEGRLRALEQRIETMSAAAPHGEPAMLPAPLAERDSERRSQHEPEVEGAAGSAGAAATHDLHLRQDRTNEELSVHVLRKLLDTDLEQGLAAIDEIVTSARGPSSARTVMRSMSLLAEVDDPATERALYAYSRGEAMLSRLHASKLLEQRGDKAPLTALIAELTADLKAADEGRKLQALALLLLADDPSTAAKIVPLLQDRSSAVRRAAVLAMQRLDDGSVHAALTPLLQDPDARVQQAAERALRGTP